MPDRRGAAAVVADRRVPPGAAAQPTNVAFYGILSDVEAKCDRAGGAVRASLDVVIIGERGPAAGRAPAASTCNISSR